MADDMRNPEVNIEASIDYDLDFPWSERDALGRPSHVDIVNIFPYHSIIYFFKSIGIEYRLIQKIWLALCFISSGLSMFYLLSKILPNYRPIAFILASIFYSTNVYAISVPFFSFYYFCMLLYIFTPLLLANLISIFTSDDFRYYIYAIILFIFNLSSLANPAHLIVEILAIVICGIYYILSYGNRVKILIRFTIYMSLFFLINAFWLLPLIFMYITGSYPYLEATKIRADVGLIKMFEKYSTILNAFRMVNWPWYYIEPVNNNIYYRFRTMFEYYGLYNTYLFIPSFILGLSTLFMRKRRKELFFPFFAIISIILINGPAKPFRSYYLLSKIIPLYYKAGVDPYGKYGTFLSISYSVSLGSFIYYMESYWARSNLRKLILICILSILFLPLALPFIYVLIGPSYANINIPESYFNVSRIINSANGDFRVLDLPPPDFSSGFRYYRWGYFGQSIFWQFINKPLLDPSFTVFGSTSTLEEIYSALYTENLTKFKELLNQYNIGYVVYHKDSTKAEEKIEQMLNNILQIEFESKELRLYRNININLENSTYISISTGILRENRECTQEIPKFYVRKISSSMYIVVIKNATKPFYVILNQSFSIHWRAYIQEDAPTISFSLPLLFSRSYVKEHFKFNDLNVWYIDSIKLNQNSDGEIILTIVFLPLCLFELGLIISISTIAFTVLVFCIKHLKKGGL
jgi:hypothetical protein